MSELVSEERKSRYIEKLRPEKFTYKGGFAGTAFTSAAATFYNMTFIRNDIFIRKLLYVVYKLDSIVDKFTTNWLN